MTEETSERMSLLTRLTVRIFRRAQPFGDQFGAFGDWLNQPSDIEGVATRIASIALAFLGAVLFSLFLCTIAYGLNLLVAGLF